MTEKERYKEYLQEKQMEFYRKETNGEKQSFMGVFAKTMIKQCEYNLEEAQRVFGRCGYYSEYNARRLEQCKRDLEHWKWKYKYAW